MPRVSRRPIRENIKEEIQDNFAYLISSLTSSKDIEQFFVDFLTHEEKVMLSKRLMLHLMLENRYEYSEISTVLGISNETIRTHKNRWLHGGHIYKIIVKKIAKREKTKEFWNKVEEILRPLELAFQAKSNSKARAKLASGDFS